MNEHDKDSSPKNPSKKEDDKDNSQQKSDSANKNLALVASETDTTAQAASEKDKKHKAHKSTAKGARKGALGTKMGVVAGLSVLAIGAALFVSFWVYQKSTQSMTNLQRQLSEQYQGLNQKLQAMQNQWDGTAQDVKNQLSSLDSRSNGMQEQQQALSQTQQQLSAQVTALANSKGKDPLMWRVAEVEFLLSVANHRLVLEQDINTAKTALQDADRRLAAIGDPAFLPIREQISGEITALESLELPDISGMSVQLASLVASIEQLPLLDKQRMLVKDFAEEKDGESAEEKQQNLLLRFWHDVFGSLFHVQRTEEPIEPLLPPQERQYLAQNLGLRLEEARIALLRRDSEAFQQNLNDTQEWVARYFDPDAAAVATLVNTINELKSKPLQVAMPDISESLRNLRRWIKSHSAEETLGFVTPAHTGVKTAPIRLSCSKPAAGIRFSSNAVSPGAHRGALA